MFYLKHEANCKTSINKGKPSNPAQSRRNHEAKTRVERIMRETLVFLFGFVAMSENEVKRV